MKKLLTLALVVISASLFGQTIEIENDSVYVYDQPSVFEIAAKSKITNNSSDTNFLFIRRQFQSCGFPETAFCDQSLCYAADDDSAEVVIQQGESFDLKVNFYPYDNQACCEVVMIVKSLSNPSNLDSCYYQVCTTNGTRDVRLEPMEIRQDALNRFVSLYTANQGSYTVKVYNILGVEVAEFNEVFNGTRLEVSNLPAGVYVIQANGEFDYTATFRKF